VRQLELPTVDDRDLAAFGEGNAFGGDVFAGDRDLNPTADSPAVAGVDRLARSAGQD
jgi:hypothetical protein